MLDEAEGSADKQKSDIKLADPQLESERNRLRKFITSSKRQVTSKINSWSKMVDKYQKMDSLSYSQKAHLKSTCKVAAESEGIDDAQQKQLDE